jgi:uncharacterized membrane protein YwaF
MLKEFLGFSGEDGLSYYREPAGAYSWQHLTFVTSLLVIMAVSAVLLGRAFTNKTDKEKNKVLIWSAILIDAFEIFKIVILCLRSPDDPTRWQTLLPLFLCSIQLFALPLAAFSKGRLKEVALDFVMIFGILGAIVGTYGAAQNYSCYPIFSIENVSSGITHSISGFASLYIMISGMHSMKKKNIWGTCAVLSVFCVLAYVVNLLIDYNYMFLMDHDGTPYQIVYNLVGGNKVAYPLMVVGLFVVYIVAFYAVYYAICKKTKKATEETEEKEPAQVK